MNPLLWILVLGIAAHMATLIITESEILRESREFVANRAARWKMVRTSLDFASALDGGQGAGRADRFRAFAWRKLEYLHGCHMCAGTWVSALIAAFIAPVGPGFVGWALSTLAISGMRHLVLVAHKLGDAGQNWLMRYADKPQTTRQRSKSELFRDLYSGRTDHVHWDVRRPGYHGSMTGRVNAVDIGIGPKTAAAMKRASTGFESPTRIAETFPKVDGLSDVEVAPETDDEMLARWRAARPADHPRWPRDSFDDEVDLQMARNWASLNPR